MECHDGINDDCYKERIALLRGHLIKELDGREEGYSDGKQLIAGQRAVNCLSFIL